MKHVTMMGAVWRINEKNFRKLQDELKRTGAVENMDRYGKEIVDRLYTISEIESELQN